MRDRQFIRFGGLRDQFRLSLQQYKRPPLCPPELLAEDDDGARMSQTLFYCYPRNMLALPRIYIFLQQATSIDALALVSRRGREMTLQTVHAYAQARDQPSRDSRGFAYEGLQLPNTAVAPADLTHYFRVTHTTKEGAMITSLSVPFKIRNLRDAAFTTSGGINDTSGGINDRH